jgi:hypothetical protein
MVIATIIITVIAISHMLIVALIVANDIEAENIEINGLEEYMDVFNEKYANSYFVQDIEILVFAAILWNILAYFIMRKYGGE